ncbi:MAG: hypothetical protein IJV12_04205 [Acidaminococcaceae bacterium]|nr:hypothetical protein [Acidaminococcaceae bacterium]
MLNPKKEPRNLCDILDELIDSMEAAAEEAEAAKVEEELAEKQAQYEEAAVNLRMIYDSFVEVAADFAEKVREAAPPAHLLLNRMAYDPVFYPLRQDDVNTQASKEMYSRMWRLRKR